MIKYKRKLFIIINLIMISIVLISCDTAKELDTIGIVISTGIDIEDEKVIITLEIVNPTASKASTNIFRQESTIFIQGTGDTIYEAGRNITLQFDRRIFSSHNNVIIFGEEFAKKGIGDYIDVYIRASEQRETSYMIIAEGAKAYEVMGVNAGLSNSSGNYIIDLIENSKYNGKTRSLTVYEYFRYYYNIDNELVLGVVKKAEKNEVSKEINKEAQQNLAGPATKKSVLDVTGGAAFRKDKLTGYYTGEEMMGFNFIVDEMEEGIIVFESPKELNKNNTHIATEGKLASIEIKKSKTKKDIKVVDGKIHLTISVKLEGGLEEETKGLDISNPEVINDIEKACSEKVKEYISMAMNKAQEEFKQDNFSIGVLFHRKYPAEWEKISKDWNSIFSDISYSVDVETQILQSGLINTPSNIRKR